MKGSGVERGKAFFMMRSIWAAPVLVVLIMMVSCTAKWAEYENKDKNFKAQFPGKPDESAESGNQGLIQYTTTMFMVEPGYGFGGRLFAVAVTGYTTTVPTPLRWNNEEVFKGAREGVLKFTAGKLVSEKEVDVSGETGREFVIETTKENAFKALDAQGKRQNPFALKNLFIPKELILAVRMIRNGNDFYQVMTIYPKGKEASADLEKFFGSFTILNKIEDPADEEPGDNKAGGSETGGEPANFDNPARNDNRGAGGGNENPPWGGQNH
jgi:hypothetical protein